MFGGRFCLRSSSQKAIENRAVVNREARRPLDRPAKGRVTVSLRAITMTVSLQQKCLLGAMEGTVVGLALREW